MSTVRFIGDVHGKIAQYCDLLKDSERTIQLGDMGMGFPGIFLPELSSRHTFIRGNHDDLEACKKHTNWMVDGYQSILDGAKVFAMGGAWSIDHAQRTPGYDWWPDEELSIADLNNMISRYEFFKPDIMVTHDCPTEVSVQLFTGKTIFNAPIGNTRTAQALQAMFDIHKPSLHLFGHWHHSVRAKIKGTDFICLNELNHIDITLT